MFPEEEKVNCGQHKARSCEECTQGIERNWCNGQCQWDDRNSKCVDYSKKYCANLSFFHPKNENKIYI